MPAAHLLRSTRHRSGLTLRAMATRAQTSHPTVAAYEQGRKDPVGSTLERLFLAAFHEIEVRPTGLDPLELATRGDQLEDLLALAEMLPYRPAAELAAPVFGRR